MQRDTAPLRYLTQLDVTAYAPDGTATAAPPVKLGYGPTTRQLSATLLAPIGHGDHGNRKGAVGSLMDMNGDGFHDRVWVELNATTKKCRLSYRPGRRGGWLEANDQHGPADGGVAERLSRSRCNGILLAQRPAVPARQHQHWRCRPGLLAPRRLRQLPLSRSRWRWRRRLPEQCVERRSQDNWRRLQQRSLLGRGGNRRRPRRRPLRWRVVPRRDGDRQLRRRRRVGGTDVLHCSCPAGTEPVDDTHCCQAGEAWGTDGCVDPNTCTALTCPPPGGALPPPGGGGRHHPICSAPNLRPELDNERFVWRVQHNDGGTLAFPDNPVQVKRVYSPRPLPPSGNELTLNRYAKPTLQTLVDIDGDGVLDVVALPGDPIGLLVDPSRNGVNPFKPLGQATTLEVRRGSVSDGDFNVSATKQSWPLPHFDVMLSGTEQNSTPPDRVQHFVTKLQAVLSDVNGDGLPDLVVEQHDGLYVGWNQQSWFGALAALGATGPIAQTQSDLTSWTASDQLSSGRSGTWKRLVDIDADGLPNLVTLARTAENVGFEPRRSHRCAEPRRSVGPRCRASSDVGRREGPGPGLPGQLVPCRRPRRSHR